MPWPITVLVLIIVATIILGWALSHILWIALGVVGGWFLRDGVDRLREYIH